MQPLPQNQLMVPQELDPIVKELREIVQDEGFGVFENFDRHNTGVITAKDLEYLFIFFSNTRMVKLIYSLLDRHCVTKMGLESNLAQR
jgi:hypothetical protein